MTFSEEHVSVVFADVLVERLKLINPVLIDSHEQKLKGFKIINCQLLCDNIILDLIYQVAVRIGPVGLPLQEDFAFVQFLYLIEDFQDRSVDLSLHLTQMNIFFLRIIRLHLKIVRDSIV